MEITDEVKQEIKDLLIELVKEYLFGDAIVLEGEEVSEDLDTITNLEIDGIEVGYATIRGIYKSVSKGAPTVYEPYTDVDPLKNEHIFVVFTGIDRTKIIFGLEVDGVLIDDSTLGTDISPQELNVAQKLKMNYPKEAVYRTVGTHIVRIRLGYVDTYHGETQNYIWFAKTQEYSVNIIRDRD